MILKVVPDQPFCMRFTLETLGLSFKFVSECNTESTKNDLRLHVDFRIPRSFECHMQINALLVISQQSMEACRLFIQKHVIKVFGSSPHYQGRSAM